MAAGQCFHEMHAANIIQWGAVNPSGMELACIVFDTLLLKRVLPDKHLSRSLHEALVQHRPERKECIARVRMLVRTKEATCHDINHDAVSAECGFAKAAQAPA